MFRALWAFFLDDVLPALGALLLSILRGTVWLMYGLLLVSVFLLSFVLAMLGVSTHESRR